jgi:hypothetical protein
VAEKVARDADASGVKNRDSRSGAGAEEVRINRLSESCAGAICDDAIDCIIGKRTAVRADPETVMLGCT